MTEGRRSADLRVTVIGTDLFADRIVRLMNSWGIDAGREHGRGTRARRSRLRAYRRLVSSDLLLFVQGRRRSGQLPYLLMWLGVPSVVFWIGTDVLLHSSHASKSLRGLAWHWCDAPWLREELAEVGISAEVIPLVIIPTPDVVPPFPRTFSALAYVPDWRPDFYRRDFIIELARRLPDVHFRLIATVRTDDLPSNVSALGWVDDIAVVLSDTTVYLRPIEHDGLSNTVLEALAYGRYVLWNYPIPGVEAVRGVESAEAWLCDLRDRHRRGALGPNQAGMEAVRAMFDESQVRDETVGRLEGLVEQGWRRSPSRVWRWLSGQALVVLRFILRSESQEPRAGADQARIREEGAA